MSTIVASQWQDFLSQDIWGWVRKNGAVDSCFILKGPSA